MTRSLLRLAAVLVAALAAAPSLEAKDLRTSFIRLVPDTDWKPRPEQSLVVEVVNSSTHEKSGEFTAALRTELDEQLGRVLKYRIDPKATTRLRVTVSEYDPGNAALRFGVGFGTGKSYVGGAIDVLEKGKKVGSLLFSVQPSRPGASAMARDTAAPLALKLHNGERDKELHAMKAKKAKGR